MTNAPDRRPIADVFRRLAKAPVRWCVRWDIHPNLVSYASVAASLGAAACFAFAYAHSSWLGLEGWASSSRSVLLISMGIAFCFLRLYFNMLDGMVAIAAGKDCPTGEIANELPDRISDVLIFVAIGHGFSIPILGYWVAIASLLVAYVGTLGKAVGAHRDFSGPMSKPWRMVAVCAGLLVETIQPRAPMMAVAPMPGPIDIALFVILVGCGVTMVRRLHKIVNALNANNSDNEDAPNSNASIERGHLGIETKQAFKKTPKKAQVQ